METFRLEGVTKERPLPSFIKKLWFIIADASSQEYIYWADSGQVVCVPDAVSFSKVILPRHFKHSNWQSFVRQLNLYGFRKVYQLSLSFDDSADKRTVWQFKHESFKKDHPELLCDIKRRTAKHNMEQYAIEQSSSSTSLTRVIAAQDSPNNISTLPPIPLPPPPISQTQPQPTPSPPVHTPTPPLPLPPPPPPITTIPQSDIPMNTHLHQQLFELGTRLEVAERKRRKLHEETVQLREIQSDQQKAIRVLMDYISELTSQSSFASEDQRLQLQNTMNKLLKADVQPRPVNPDIQPRLDLQQQQQTRLTNPYLQPPLPPLPPQQHQQPEYTGYDSDINSVESNTSSSNGMSSGSASHYPMETGSATVQQNYPPTSTHRRPLPSISSLMGDNADRMLPPIRNNNNNRRNNGR